MDLNTIDKMSVHGTVERQLFDTAKFNKAREALIAGNVALYDKLIEEAKKPMFKENKFWRFIRDTFNIDLQIPLITGYWTKQAIVSDNLVTTRGKQALVEQLNGVTTSPMTAIALGTSGTSPAAGDTALGAESSTNGGSRGAATTSSVTTTTTKDTAQWVKTFTFSGALALQEEGIFDNNASGGNMLAHNTFTTVNVVNTDTLQITHKVSVA